MSRISTTEADQRCVTTFVDFKQPTLDSNRPANQPQSVCENEPDLALSSRISAPLVVRFKSGAAQTDRFNIVQTEVAHLCFLEPLVQSM